MLVGRKDFLKKQFAKQIDKEDLKYIDRLVEMVIKGEDALREELLEIDPSIADRTFYLSKRMVDNLLWFIKVEESAKNLEKEIEIVLNKPENVISFPKKET